MKSKEQILSTFKKNYKPCFLLAWLRFLSYDEMSKLDLLEPYDAALSAKQVKSSKDWDNLIIQYDNQNLLYGLCILMRKLFNSIVYENWVMSSIYANDIKIWLYILDDDPLFYIEYSLKSSHFCYSEDDAHLLQTDNLTFMFPLYFVLIEPDMDISQIKRRKCIRRVNHRPRNLHHLQK